MSTLPGVSDRLPDVQALLDLVKWVKRDARSWLHGPTKQAAVLPFEDQTMMRLPGADLATPARVRTSPRERERLIAEAAGQHYQDQPWLTSGVVGAGAGGLLGALLAGPGQAGHHALLGAGLGALSGVGNEALSRLLTRYVGPRFQPSRWAHDQDPHRWNSALKVAPLAVSIPTTKLLLAHLNSKSAAMTPPSLPAALLPHAPDASTRDALTQMAADPSGQATQSDLITNILTRAVVGTTLPILAGAGLGAGIQHLRRDPRKAEKDQPSRLKGALVGMGIGGAGGLLGALDAPRSGFNASVLGRGMGTVSPSDYYSMLLRMLAPGTREGALDSTVQNSFVRKWAPTGALNQ